MILFEYYYELKHTIILLRTVKAFLNFSSPNFVHILNRNFSHRLKISKSYLEALK